MKTKQKAIRIRAALMRFPHYWFETTTDTAVIVGAVPPFTYECGEYWSCSTVSSSPEEHLRQKLKKETDDRLAGKMYRKRRHEDLSREAKTEEKRALKLAKI